MGAGRCRHSFRLQAGGLQTRTHKDEERSWEHAVSGRVGWMKARIGAGCRVCAWC